MLYIHLIPNTVDSLQWRHMRIMESQITKDSTIYSTAQVNNRENPKVLHCVPYAKGIRQQKANIAESVSVP